jgi:crotonobetainyl-CoA:carnitine CoA-transferase CaiB-like acyl-CoA transferase
MTAEPGAPLSGVRIIEIAGLASAFAGRQLAELGAEVILVEPPAGAPSRHRLPFLEGESGVERSLHHLHYNAGKLSVVLDLEKDEGAAGLRRLVAGADALIESADVGAMDALGLGYDDLKRLNPALLHVTVTPFGQDGPLGGYRGNDLIGAAASGVMYLNGFPQDPPNVPGAEQAFHMASLAAVSTLLVALVGHERGLGGHRIDVSIQEAMSIATIQTANANFYSWHQVIPKRVGVGSTLSARSLFPCADGKWISFTVPIGAPTIWPNFTGWLEEEGIIEPGDERFVDSSVRSENPQLVAQMVEQLCARHPREYLFKEGQRLRLLAMPVNSARDLVEDEHLEARGFFATASMPQLDVQLTDVSPPYYFSATPAARAMVAPVLGADTAAVLGSAEPPPAQPTATTLAGGGVYRPLEGIRVCDFTWMLAGPLTTRVLADYGADVIKLESESRMDNIRITGSQPRAEGSINTNGVFNDASVNKRAAQLNLKEPQGRELAKELVARSDIVTNNYTPDRMDRWGLGYDDLRRIKPDIIMLTMPVMSRTGPYKSYGSYGNGVIAYGGLSQTMGFAHRPPSGLAPLYSDFAAPYFAVSSILAALHHRERTGAGQFIELAQAEATVNLLGPDILEVTANGDLPPRIGNRSRDLVPHGAFQCAGDDRWIAIACADDADWQRLANALAAPELASDSRFTTTAGRREHEDDLEALIGARTGEHDAWELMHALQAAGVMAAVVEDLEDMVTRDPHLQRHLVPISDPRDDFTFLTHAQPARVDGTLAPIRRSPYWAEHNTEVYRDLLGLSDSEIADLVAAQVIF